MDYSQDTKNILGLQLPTDPRWVNLAEMSIEEILTDHAFCEQKAATSCISLIQRYSSKEKLVTALSPIVTEEWGHFRLVLAELHKRNQKLGKQRKDEYVAALIDFQQKGGDDTAPHVEPLILTPAVDQHRLPVRQLQHRTVPLSDIEKSHAPTIPVCHWTSGPDPSAQCQRDQPCADTPLIAEMSRTGCEKHP